MSEVTAFIGFGANLGDPIQQILDARRYLSQQDGISNLVHSPLYLSSPIGYEGQPDFVNCVSSIETSLSAHSLLYALQQIENRLGRKRDFANQDGPRTIDLDLLLFGSQNINDEQLVVPHPRLETRLFTLMPLCQLAPSLSWSASGSVSDILKRGHTAGLFNNQDIYQLT